VENREFIWKNRGQVSIIHIMIHIYLDMKLIWATNIAFRCVLLWVRSHFLVLPAHHRKPETLGA